MEPDQIPLRDLHLPDMTGWWPLAPGWWVVIVLLVAALAWLLVKLWQRWRFNAARRFALRQLASIRSDFERGADAVVLGKQLSELMRRAMIAYAPRKEVAGLTGDAWLAWLDRDLSDSPFTGGAGSTIETLPYMNPERVDNDTDVSGLIDAVRLRLQTPVSGGAN